MAEQSIIALDVGGSSVKSALVDANDFSVRRFRMDDLDSAADATAIIDSLTGVIRVQREGIGEGDLLGIAIGFPGPFDYGRGISLMKGGLRAEPGISHTGGRAKFESLYDMNLREALRDRLGSSTIPILFRNDAEAAILGEARFGAGRTYRRVIGVTLGTGLGSAFVADGQVVLKDAAVPPNGWLYCMPFNGAQADETFSTRGLARRLREAGVAYEDAKSAGEAARSGDIQALTAFLDFGHALGLFLTPYVTDFHAQAVLVLGGIANAFDLFQPSLTSALRVPAQTGAPDLHAALLGAAEMFIKRT